MNKPTVDMKRTVPVKVIDKFPRTTNPLDTENWFAEPGTIELPNEALPGLLGFACPGCGNIGHISIGEDKPEPSPSWKITAGTHSDPKTLTLAPSIECIGCCKWHGHLKNGIFESC